MKEWFIDQTWDQVFEQILVDKLDDFFPQKTRKIQSDDQPYITNKLKQMDRKRKRVFHKERRSEKWKILNKKFKKELKCAKATFYRNKVTDFKTKKPGQWYASLKRLTSYDQLKNDQPTVDEINHLSDQQQSEVIAEKFAKIQNEYQPLKSEDILCHPLNRKTFHNSIQPRFGIF